jgi:hypothetical protein
MLTQQLPDWIGSHSRAFESFGRLLSQDRGAGLSQEREIQWVKSAF